jgi:hypothetical protein
LARAAQLVLFATARARRLYSSAVQGSSGSSAREALPGRISGIIALRGLVLPGLRLTMPCFLLLVILLFPRVALVLMWIFSTYLQRAFHGGLVLPVLGFIFLPLTTLVYAWELNSGMPTAGINLLWLLIAVIIDLGGLGGGAHRQSRR